MATAHMERAEATSDPGRRRNERLILAGVLAYAAIVVLFMFLRGIEITPDVMAIAFGLGAVLLGRGRLFLRDWIPFVALFLAYELMRGLADNVGFGVHVDHMVAAERLLTFGNVPTELLQRWLHPATGTDPFAILATIVYMLHFALPLVTGFILWVWRRAHYFDFVAALILLSLWAFVTFVVMPTAPPWYAAQAGALNGPDGRPLIAYLKPGAFEQLAAALGFNGRYIYTYTFYDVGPNSVAAWPSLHMGYATLSFLVLRRAFGRIGWAAFAYALLVAFSIMYTGDHWLIDVIGGAAFAYVSYYAVVHGPARVRGWLAQMRDDGAAASATGGLRRLLRAPGEAIVWPRVVAGLVVAAAGIWAVGAMEHAGQAYTPLFLVPWAVLIAGSWLAAAGLIRR